jgi:hypothetical protein
MIPLDDRLVRGSHGRVDVSAQRAPICIVEQPPASLPERLPCTAIRDLILEQLFSQAM